MSTPQEDDFICYGCGTTVVARDPAETYGVWCTDCGGRSQPVVNYREAIRNLLEKP